MGFVAYSIYGGQQQGDQKAVPLYTATAYGMEWKEAYKSVSIIPAQIFGLEKTYGSIALGKVANIFVADGDPFETKTQIRHLFIRGNKVPLESRHSYLYDEFLEREPGLGND